MAMGVVVFFLILFSSTCWGETYRWVDEKGTINFTQDYHSIPEKYRDRVKEIPDKQDVEPKADEGSLRRSEGRPGDGLKESVGRNLSEEEPINKNRIESAAAEALRIILLLWRDQQYEALYEYGTEASRRSVSKEGFVQRMKRSNRGLAPSWEAVRDIETKFSSPTLVYASAKVGYRAKSGGNVRFTRETYRMALEDGMWRTDLSHF